MPDNHPTFVERMALLEVERNIRSLIANHDEKLATLEKMYLLPGGQRIPILLFRSKFAKLRRDYVSSLTATTELINRDGPFTVVDDTFDFRMTDNHDTPLTFVTYTDAVMQIYSWFSEQGDTQVFIIRNNADDDVATIRRVEVEQ